MFSSSDTADYNGCSQNVPSSGLSSATAATVFDASGPANACCGKKSSQRAQDHGSLFFCDTPIPPVTSNTKKKHFLFSTMHFFSSFNNAGAHHPSSHAVSFYHLNIGGTSETPVVRVRAVVRQPRPHFELPEDQEAIDEPIPQRHHLTGRHFGAAADVRGRKVHVEQRDGLAARESGEAVVCLLFCPRSAAKKRFRFVAGPRHPAPSPLV